MPRANDARCRGANHAPAGRPDSGLTSAAARRTHALDMYLRAAILLTLVTAAGCPSRPSRQQTWATSSADAHAEAWRRACPLVVVSWPSASTPEADALRRILADDAATRRLLADDVVLLRLTARQDALRPVSLVLDAKARVVEAMPGVLVPERYARRLAEALAVARRSGRMENHAEAIQLIADWHAQQHEMISDETVAALVRATAHREATVRAVLPEDEIHGDDFVFASGSFAAFPNLPGGCVVYGPSCERRLVPGSEGLTIVLDDGTWRRLATSEAALGSPQLDLIAARNAHDRSRVVARRFAYGVMASEPADIAGTVGALP